MNFNTTTQPDYDLNTSLTEELIDLYGIPVKFLIAEKINNDDLVFGDYSHLKTDSEKIFDFFMMPEISEDWDTSSYNFTGFGLMNFDNISLFAMRTKFEGIGLTKFTQVVGNLVILPNNKIMEITDVDPTVPGVNNLFTYNDAKSVYKLSLKPYNFKLIEELDTSDISVGDVPYESLDNYFEELVNTKNELDNATEVEETVQTVIKNPSADADTIKNSSIINNDEKDVWGSF